MSYLLSIFLVLVLLVLAYQDWKDREVTWWLFVPLGILLFYNSYQEVSPKILLFNFGCNLGYLIFQLGVIWIYFYLKTKEKQNIINRYFGLGDLILLLIFGFGFSFINYVIFLMIGMVFSIAVHLVLSIFVKLQNNSVPLVTYFSFFYLLLWLLQTTGIFESSRYFLFLNH